MAQISPPLRIALAAVVLLSAVWFFALRPRPDAAPATAAPAATAPGVAGLTRSIDKARNATDAANASVARAEKAASSVGSAAAGTAAVAPSVAAARKAAAAKVAPATTAPKVVAATRRSPVASLVSALNHQHAVVLMFRNGSSDSAAVARTVRGLSRRHGNVVVRVARISEVGKYQVFTRTTPVSQAPSVLVIGPGRQAKLITGFTARDEINQAITDVLVVSRRTRAKTSA